MKSRNNTLAKNNSGTQHKNQDIYDPDQTLNRELGDKTIKDAYAVYDSKIVKDAADTIVSQQIATPSESQKEKLEVISMHDMED